MQCSSLLRRLITKERPLKISVGDREQIASAALLVPEGEDAWIEFTADSWLVRLNVQFADDPEVDGGGVSLTATDDHAVLTFKNWNTALPAAIPKPFGLGETGGRKIYFLCTGYSVSGFKRLDLSFFWGASNGK